MRSTSGAASPREAPRVDHATLLAAAAAGKDARVSQRDACRKVLAQVYRVVAAVLGPRSADVADVAQEAFLRVHRNIPRFVYDEAKPGGPTAWINTIALRTALDHRAGLPPWEGVDGSEAESIPSEDGDEKVDTLDRNILVAALLHRLDERHRAILILAYWNGETQEEISKELSIPLGTVKTRMRAAHRMIRDHVLAHSGEPGAAPGEGEPESESETEEERMGA